jgi:hypothetical protein
VELNDLRIKVERLTEKVGYLEDASKGSISTREERAGTTATIKSNIKTLFIRVSALETADKDLNNRFFQVWVGILFVFIGVIVDYLKK